MNSVSKRAIRRHHYRRLQKARKNYWGCPIRVYEAFERPPMTNRELGIVANTPHSCSCTGGCGHMRQAYGPTRQELRSE
jgi:hypothetical protein